MMKLNIILILCFFAINTWANPKTDNEIGETPVNTREFMGNANELLRPQQFSLKQNLNSEQKAQKFLINLFATVDLNSPQEVEALLRENTKELFFGSFFKHTPLLSTFLFKLSQNPKAIANLGMIFLQKNKLIFFGTFLFFSMFFSHMLNGHIFKLDLFSYKRFLATSSSIIFINTIRLGVFSFLFDSYLSDSLKLFSEATHSFKGDYFFTSLVADLLTKFF